MLWNWLRQWTQRWRNLPSRPRRRRARRSVPLCIERLEGRMLLSAGALDLSFGTGGLVTTNFGADPDGARAVAIQADGKIVAAGFVQTDNSPSVPTHFALARYNTDGSLDTTFDGDGRVVTDFGTGKDYAHAVAIQADGKIVAAGYASNGINFYVALARYNTDGSLDTTFDGDGRVITTIGTGTDVATDVAIQTDGKIVITGYAFVGSDYDFALARYNTDGSLDTTFDGDGRVSMDFGTGDGAMAYAGAIQADGKIIAAGYTRNGASIDFALARFNTDGSLDSTFDGDGRLLTDFVGGQDEVNAVTVQTDGKIVAAGFAYIGSNNPQFALARYNTDGSLDTAFDGDGRVSTDFGTLREYAYAVAIQADGKIVAAGQTSQGNFILARYIADGSLDTTFDGDGRVSTDGVDCAYAVAIQADGKIVAAGISGAGFALARYLCGNEPPPDTAPVVSQPGRGITNNEIAALSYPLPLNLLLPAAYSPGSEQSFVPQTLYFNPAAVTALFPSDDSGVGAGAGSALFHADAGSAIAGEIFHDANQNGEAERGENRAAGVELILERDQNGTFVSVARTTTDAEGRYAFDGLAAGTYRVRPADKNGADGKGFLIKVQETKSAIHKKYDKGPKNKTSLLLPETPVDLDASLAEAWLTEGAEDAERGSPWRTLERMTDEAGEASAETSDSIPPAFFQSWLPEDADAVTPGVSRAALQRPCDATLEDWEAEWSAALEPPLDISRMIGEGAGWIAEEEMMLG